MKKGTSEIVVVLDRSGSMMSIKQDAIGGFNQFVEEQKAVPGEAFLTFVQFDTRDPHEIIHERVPLADVPLLTDEVFRPRGGTPLYDALGWTINHIGALLDKQKEDEKPEHVIFAILTDGQENSSHEFSKAALFAKVTEQQEKYDWKFIYLGANQDAMAESAGIGIKFDAAAQNVAAFAATGAGVQQAFGATTRSALHYRL